MAKRGTSPQAWARHRSIGRAGRPCEEGSKKVYDILRGGHHRTLFSQISHFPPDVFDYIFMVVESFIAKPLSYSRVEAPSGVAPRKRVISNLEMFFLLLSTLGAGDECSPGVRHIAHRNGIRPATAPRYMEHAILKLHEMLKEETIIFQWPSADEREHILGLVPGFPKCVGFVTGAKIGR